MPRPRIDLAFCWVGRTSAPYARTGIDEYRKRLERYARVRTLGVAEERQGGRYTRAHRLEREGRAIEDRLAALERPWIAVLDPRGEQLRTADFAAALERAAVVARRPGVFVVGGPDGLSSSVRQRAHRLIALTRWTVPHDMARLLVVEQVYRAMTIVHGHPYDR